MLLVLYREDGTKVEMRFSLHLPTYETDLRENLRNVGEDEIVSAQLMRESDEELHIRDAFILQVGFDPDYAPKLERLKPSEETPTSRDFEQSKESETFTLFYDTIGESSLLLYHCEKDGTREVNPIFSTPVVVLPSRERQQLMEATVRELLQIAPQTIWLHHGHYSP